MPVVDLRARATCAVCGRTEIAAAMKLQADGTVQHIVDCSNGSAQVLPPAAGRRCTGIRTICARCGETDSSDFIAQGDGTWHHTQHCPSAVNHPPHYTQHPSGIECITITEAFNFNLGNVIKYVWRAGLKPGAAASEDLAKAQFYLQREIDRLPVRT